ncbi:hypothetical protein AAG570_007990 [Ranatra chinensis]|uniref:Phospholipid/glycerol acyltransferase domain-containing protein n=1 Tax=Ranatra chinensis TaxID=642074 RepID=A0ABD0YF84_9HEMI
MWLMGKLLRASKAFYMRRTFSDNLTYRLIFEDYVHSMVALGESPIEFFIEGTRSRSAKSLMPKLGFLGMVLEPFFSGDVPDITIVPVSINYDRLLEEVLFAYEHLGIPKPKESTVVSP